MAGYVSASLASAMTGDSGAAVRLAAWTSIVLAPAAMIIGHLGSHELGWDRNYISTFAARAPNGDWVTAAMLLSAFAMLSIGIIAGSRDGPYGKLIGNLIAMSMGAAVSGLLLLAAFEEKAASLSALKKLGFAEIRQQSFHDAGLFIFFYGIVLALLVAGVAMLAARGASARMLGLVVAASGPLSYAALTTSWPVAVGIAGADVGLKQRAAFLLLWIGALALLTLLSRRRQAGPGQR